jgi:DNA polymerase-3 subunit delta'
MPFDEIIGHQKVIQMLRQFINHGRLPHALLLNGPDGIGKKLTAFGLAKALLCERSKDDYCDVCASCQKINQGNHPDVTLIQPEGNSIKIEQLRDWQKGLQSRSYFGSWRVTIIDQAERMSIAAANSILKALEEPPENTIICLITVEARDILPTILSRCQILRFSSLSRSSFIRIAMKRRELTELQAGLIFNLSKGQLSQGMSMDLNHMTQLREQWRGLLDLPDSRDRTAPRFDQSSLLEGLEIMAYWWRDIILLQSGIEGSSLTNQDMLGELKKEAKKTPGPIVKYRLDLILQSINALERNANPKITIDSLLLQWDNKGS